MSRRALQIATAILGLVPRLTGLVTMLGVHDPLSSHLPPHALLDSDLRFFGGVWCGLGVAVLWMAPSIERQATLRSGVPSFPAAWGVRCRSCWSAGRCRSSASRRSS